MNLRDLSYFIILAETKHFGAAAKRCYVSQPTLSMQIKKLEDDLGVSLFERTNKQVFLTDQGTALLPLAKKILIQVNELKDAAHYLNDPFAGDLHLGAIPTVAPYLLPLIMPTLKQQFPHLKIWLVEEQTQRLIEKLEDGTLDAAIMADPIHQVFTRQALFEEVFYFACSKNNPLAGLTSISLNQLAGQELLLLEEGHCLREQAMAVCQMAKANNSIADFTATSLETLRLMVQADMGVTLLPALSVLSHSSDLLCCIPFLEPMPSRTLALFWRTSSPKQQCLEAIVEKIKEVKPKKL
ncbi:LysR substrate-binding domain-containing protein [Legionella sp. km772]|uniref:LysR substrate-binding domain-containing protein n=1 Tax=Legionella sp. km772 TaxID=2498111 RepID=UPI000F8C6576|nr:LysR substrate-binding domain-containing protein [Legionella sp. km772]RUR10690.1 LysR family transcriptional regulator [Legionella sp. km772]